MAVPSCEGSEKSGAAVPTCGMVLEEKKWEAANPENATTTSTRSTVHMRTGPPVRVCTSRLISACLPFAPASVEERRPRRASRQSRHVRKDLQECRCGLRKTDLLPGDSPLHPATRHS